MTNDACFLCNPDRQLVVTQNGPFYTMVGLGPLTSAYAMIVATDHVRSLADIAMTAPDKLEVLFQTRALLQKAVGPLLMTEHGRVPVCREDGDRHDQHCFHAHALFFSCGTSIVAEATSFYKERRNFDNIKIALDYASTTDNYLLISETATHYAVLSGPINAPRQLARTLVAIKHGDATLADWRESPRIEDAHKMADHFRKKLDYM